MGLLSIFKNRGAEAVETDSHNNMWYWQWMNEACRSFYGCETLEIFSNKDAYILASTISEIFFPIDAIADRVAGLKFDVEDKNGNIKEPSENIKRLIDQPNPFSTFSELVYNSVFNELADGNNYIYQKIPSSYKTVNSGVLSSIWLLRPDKVDVKIKNTRPNFFEVKSKSDLIEYYKYDMYDNIQINPNHVIHERNLPIQDYSSGLKSPSSLQAVQKNINNLIAVYSARYNVYAKNGNSGILTREGSPNSKEIEQAVDPVTRDQILNDIKNRNGLTGDKQFWSVSPIPLKFIKTLGTISELQPFEETQADAFQIAGIFGVDKDLVPNKDGTTFTNKAQAEKNLYQNVIKGIANNKAESLTKAFCLDQENLRFVPKYDHIEVLQEDKETSYKGDSMLIDNLIRMREAGLIEDKDVQEIAENVTNKYKNG